MAEPLRVAVADDAVLLREGIAQLLRAGGLNVVAMVGSADELLTALFGDDADDADDADDHTRLSVDAVVLDIRMPPSHTDEGLRALETIRSRDASVGVLLLSMYTTVAYAIRAMNAGAGTGYLLKDRVADADTLVRAVTTVAAGGSVVDPDVVALLVEGQSRSSALESLSYRERQVVELMAEGRSNAGIAASLNLSMRTIESHVGKVMDKFGIDDSSDEHRRVAAVLRYLGQSG